MTDLPSNSGVPAPRVEMFSGPGCAYCARTRELLTARGLDFVEYDISESGQLDEFTRRLPRTKSIPQIFIDGQHIGSWEDLQILDADGRLARLVSDS